MYVYMHVSGLDAEILRVLGLKGGNKLAINVTISNFTPKPHTPFQWHSVSTSEFERKQALLRAEFQCEPLASPSALTIHTLVPQQHVPSSVINVNIFYYKYIYDIHSIYIMYTI